MKELRGTYLIAAISIACGFGFALFGYVALQPVVILASYDQAIAGGIISGPQFKQQFDNPSQTMQGVITSSYHIGCAVGALLSFVIGELGRKKCIASDSLKPC